MACSDAARQRRGVRREKAQKEIREEARGQQAQDQKPAQRARRRLQGQRKRRRKERLGTACPRPGRAIGGIRVPDGGPESAPFVLRETHGRLELPRRRSGIRRTGQLEAGAIRAGGRDVGRV